MDKNKVKNILIVDDEEINRKLIKMLINRLPENFNIFEAETGKEAVNLLKTQKFDIVLLDILLPDVNGIELIKKIKNSKIIIISALSKDEISFNITDFKNIEYISKPFDINYFHKLLNDEIQK